MGQQDLGKGNVPRVQEKARLRGKIMSEGC